MTGLALGLLFISFFLLAIGVAQAMSRERLVAAHRLHGRQPPAEVPRQERVEKPRMSSIGGLQCLLERLPRARGLEARLRSAGSSMSVGVFILLIATVGLTAGTAGWWVTDSLTCGLGGGAVGAGVPIAWLSWKRRQRTQAFERQFPDALDLMATALKSGAGLSSALHAVAEGAAEPVNTEFGVVIQQQKVGVDLREALIDLRRRIDLVDVHLFATALVVQRETGGNLAGVLDNIAVVIRDRCRVMGDARTLTAEGRMSGMILALLPIVLGLVIFRMAPEHGRFFFDHPIGKMMLMGAALMQTVGLVLIRKISNVKL